MKAATLLPTTCFLLVYCLASAADPRPDAVVSLTGEGDFKTVQEAINKTPQTTTSEKPWTILIKPGTYKELIHIQREKRFVRLLGEDPKTTVITYGLFASMKGPDGLDIGTFRTPTVLIDADDFAIEKLTLENSAGPVGQALAVRVDGDRVAFRDCVFNGHQDTILINRGRQYFENCTISGTVDFIFGGATAWFERCTMNCLRDGYITAASTPAEAAYGFVFSNCTINVDPGKKVYLGRPWRPYAATIFLNTRMTEGIRPEGWNNWDKPERETTARYSEFGSTGPGASPESRVKWARPLDAKQAGEVTVSRVLGGWTP
jgi:pectinesterase